MNVITKLKVAVLLALLPSVGFAQGWPAQYEGVMLQGFYWNSYADTQWSYLEDQADDLSCYFSLIWIPQSGYCGASNNMGYLPLYYWKQDSSFGSEAQLRSMIKTFKEKGLGTIADVVINHRNNMGVDGSWVDYPVETYKGKTYQMLPTDICSNDDGGQTKAWATSKGISISSNADTGEGWDGCRDLDHKSENVNKVIKAYLDYLLNDLGYSGFRYDMVKGYSASFTADYNSTSKPAYSVGEYWSSTTDIKRWIDGTKVDGVPQSGAFDFQFRYRLRDAFNQNNFSKLNAANMDAGGTPMAYDATYRRYAITFVENHDTEYRSAGEQQDPFKGDTVAANAMMLSMPGTPCIFLKHWQDKKKELKMLIEARHLAGITNTSDFTMLENSMYYAFKTVGVKGTLLCVVGSAPSSYKAPTDYKLLCSGTKYCVYINSAAYGDWDTTKARIEEEEKTAPFEAHKATIYLRDPGFSPVYFYSWDKKGNQLLGNWPGKSITATKEINGQKWYYETFDVNTADYTFSIIFNKGNGKAQTADIGNISSDKYYTVTDTGGSLSYTDVTKEMTTGIEEIEGSTDQDQGGVCESNGRFRGGIYDLTGRRVLAPQKGRLYIKNGKKVVL